MTEPVPPELPRATLHVVERWVLTRRATLGFAIAFVLFVAAGIGGFREQRHIAEAGEWSMHTMEVVDQSRVVVRMMTDAETGERGYLLTGDARYLTAYDEADKTLFDRMAALTQVTSDNALEQRELEELRPLLASKLAELRVAVALRRSGNVEAARATLDADPGSGKTQRIRVLFRELQDRERVALQERIANGVLRGTRVRGLVALATVLGAAIALASLIGLNLESQKRLVAEREVARIEIAEQEARKTLEDRNRTLSALRAAQAEAEAASRSKDEFLAVLSHELRSPLNAILGWVTMLKTGTLAPEKVSRALATIERNVNLQTQLVNDLLDVSRITSGKLALERELVDFSALVHVAVETARPAAEAKGLTFTAKLAQRTGAVFGDEKRLQQVVLNLITNAIKFTPSGGTLSVTLAPEEGDVVLRVEDTGIGISKEFLPFVFDRFRQADGSTTRRHGGLGLGLSIVSTLVGLHGGTVEAESAGAGRGAAFTVRLPIRAPELALAPPQAEADRDGLRGMKIVVVEDDADAREALCLVLEDSGARVEACGSTSEAMLAIERLVPDLIVSDIGMPGEDGYQFMRRVRARNAVRVPAIAVTGFASRQDEEEAARSGFDAHIAKPVSPHVLVSKAKDLIRGHRVSSA